MKSREDGTHRFRAFVAFGRKVGWRRMFNLAPGERADGSMKLTTLAAEWWRRR